MPDSNKPKADAHTGQLVARQLVAPARRRLLHGGLAAGPVLMTLFSRPVLGAAKCVTPSAFCSGNVSTVGGVGVVCEGRGANYWANNPGWPDPYTPDTPFTDVFGPNPDYQCMTLQDVLTLPDTSGAVTPPTPPPKSRSFGHKPDLTPHSGGPDSSGGHDSSHGQGTHGPQTPDPFSFELKPLAYDPFGQQSTQQGSRDRGNSQHDSNEHGQKHSSSPFLNFHKKKPPVEAPPEPVVSDPAPPTTPLGCNDNTVAAPGAPASDPGTSPPGMPKHKGFGSLSGGGLRSGSSHVQRAPKQADYLARDIVASLLNAQAGLTPGISVGTVKGIWKEYATKGFFEPAAGVQWGFQDIMTYIASIQPA